MLTNKEKREEWLYQQTRSEENTVLNDEVTGIIVKRIQINANLFYNKIYVRSEYLYSAVYSYCSNSEGVTVDGLDVPGSDAQVINYLKDHRNDPFVKELSL